MKRSELVAILSRLPDIEVGNMQGDIVFNAEISTYDDETGEQHEFIALDMSDD